MREEKEVEAGPTAIPGTGVAEEVLLTNVAQDMVVGMRTTSTIGDQEISVIHATTTDLLQEEIIGTLEMKSEREKVATMEMTGSLVTGVTIAILVAELLIAVNIEVGLLRVAIGKVIGGNLFQELREIGLIRGYMMVNNQML